MVELYVFFGGNFKFFRWGKITPSKKGSGAGKITTLSFGVILPILSDIITLARCVILQVKSCIIPILHYFACKFTIILRVKLHFRSWCNNTHKKADCGAGNNFTPFLSIILHFNF